MSMQPWEVEHIEREQARERATRTHYHVRQGAAAAVPGGDAGTVFDDLHHAIVAADNDVADLEEAGFQVTECPGDIHASMTREYDRLESVRYYLEIPERYGAAQIVEIERCQEDCL